MNYAKIGNEPTIKPTAMQSSKDTIKALEKIISPNNLIFNQSDLQAMGSLTQFLDQKIHSISLLSS